MISVFALMIIYIFGDHFDILTQLGCIRDFVTMYKIHCLNTFGWRNGKGGPTYSHSREIHPGWEAQHATLYWPLTTTGTLIDLEEIWQIN